MGDRAFAVPTVLTIVWVALWIISYDNVWLKIPVIAKLFPLPLPNGNLSYADTVTSIGIVGTLILAVVLGMVAVSEAKEQVRGLHRS